MAGLKKDEKIAYKSATEAKLAQIWKGLLGFEPIPRTESFFDLGGDSLMATTLFLRIENEFDKILPLSTLIHAPTLETLSRRIEDRFEEINNGKFRCLRVIQPGNKNEVPLFLVHGGGGNVLRFRDLAEGLDADIPVFAFQWPGWDGGRGPADILDMAKCYKKELRQAWPSGPYRIGGHCIGGVIALELARMLRAEGAEIWNPILVTDSPNLHSKRYRTNEPFVSDKEFLAFKKIKYELTSRIPVSEGKSQKDARKNKIKINQPTGIRKVVRKMPYFSFIKRRLKIFYSPIEFLIRNGRNEAIRFKFWCMLQLSKPVPVPERQKYEGISGIHAINKHKKRVYNMDILYLRSKLLYGRRLGLRGWWNDVFMGFGELCSGHFDAHVIGGGHNDIFTSLYALKLIREKMFSGDKFKTRNL
jgi:acyl carrier protein